MNTPTDKLTQPIKAHTSITDTSTESQQNPDNRSLAGANPTLPTSFIFTDAVLPAQMGDEIAADAAAKDKYDFTHLLILGFLCTPLLGYAAAFSIVLVTYGWPVPAAALVFPIGFAMVATLGLEMATGSFSVMPIGMYAHQVTPWRVVRNWGWTLLGNLLGGIFFACLLWFSLTRGSDSAPQGVIAYPILAAIAQLAENKVSYMQHGVAGWFAAVGMGILCNWLVSLGPIFAKAARSVSGKIILIWLPISTFFALGLEHAIVNMFIFPMGILAGANVSLYDWWVWNQIPVLIGNILGALFFNATLWYHTHALNPAKPKF
jgi:formate transporter